MTWHNDNKISEAQHRQRIEAGRLGGIAVEKKYGPDYFSMIRKGRKPKQELLTKEDKA